MDFIILWLACYLEELRKFDGCWWHRLFDKFLTHIRQSCSEKNYLTSTDVLFSTYVDCYCFKGLQCLKNISFFYFELLF